MDCIFFLKYISIIMLHIISNMSIGPVGDEDAGIVNKHDKYGLKVTIWVNDNCASVRH